MNCLLTKCRYIKCQWNCPDFKRSRWKEKYCLHFRDDETEHCDYLPPLLDEDRELRMEEFS